MRKAVVSALMMTLLLLAGCGAREARTEKVFEDFRAAVLDMETLTARAELTADYGETTERYVLDLTCDGTETVLELREPELIAGVRAVARRGEASIEYENVLLAAGPLDEEGLTPVSALPAILEAMAGGYTELLWRDGDLVAARLYSGKNARCTLWLEPDTLRPTAAEIACDGRTVLSCRFTEWELRTNGEPTE